MLHSTSRMTAAARASVPPFHVMEVLSAAARRQRVKGDVVSLAAGQPSSPAPAPVLAAAERALREHPLGYTENLGMPELREAIAGHYARRHDLDVSPDEVVVTTGSSGAFLLAFLAAFDAGDRVALPRPGYPAYRNILRALGCEVVELDCGPETRFHPTVEQLEALEAPVRGLVVASPANPTGTVLDPAELAELAGWCAEHDVQFVSDEIYDGINFGRRSGCAWATSRDAVVVNSFSKYFAMTGWRLGWMLLPHRLLRAVDCLAGNFTVCPPTLAQHAAVAAFDPESYAEADAHVARYRTNRDLLLAGLTELGITRLAPADGAFYAYADVSHLGEDSMALCQRLLDETGVAVVPGIDFDPANGGRFVRMSFAGVTEDVREALRRLGEWLPSV
ncbi:pyridoxal phosphate-dependent aminotransferase [Gandjariella thermophila]|uniref:Aminotransferase n=1 Tax=Gandjariella thermophila TaxID=1931992 RepID=A0A4D4JBS7_9PSEU|nr:pyridoxal phosphate-dependent aminotransferase [Gandjariella thermophila]GDY32118.1 aminotransferase [Gandjariella thermophila]